MKSLTRFPCGRTCRRRKRYLFILIGIICFFSWVLNKCKETTTNFSCTPIDVVYTWVNGSDKNFIETVLQYDSTYDPSRYEDKNELKYSLRSLERYAPWVHHVYIVTNGQIPNWLDLTYDRVTVVPHELLIPNRDLLPTFSSAAIETFLHRIPKLSKRFLYLNDDIFLGAPVYPEDLYTDSEGVRIYQAWMVPDCAQDCPWTYMGDGACDQHCNIAQCQYDGGDCEDLQTTNQEAKIISIQELKIAEERSLREKEQEKLKTLHYSNSAKKVKLAKKNYKLGMRKKFRNNSESVRHASHFKDFVFKNNISTLNELRSIVDNYNKAKSKKEPTDLNSEFRSNLTVEEEKTRNVFKQPSQDIYSLSLLHTNKMLNNVYGFKARNVPAHVGFLLERDIIDAMQNKFPEAVSKTLTNRFRSGDDLQFAFTYYSFLMSETHTIQLSEIFDEFDTDKSQTWSDREVRTMLARIYPLPLDWSAVHFFEEVIKNCSKYWTRANQYDNIVYSTLVYERYADSNLPTINRELVANCGPLAETLETNFGVRPKYKFNTNPKHVLHSNFIMLKSNITDVVYSLDKLRRNPQKFNCINDNLNASATEDNELIRHILEDFYVSVLPQRSSFELQPTFRNRFANWYEYQRWRRRKRVVLFLGYAIVTVLLLFFLRFVCIHKAKYARRYFLTQQDV